MKDVALLKETINGLVFLASSSFSYFDVLLWSVNKGQMKSDNFPLFLFYSFL
jgi:hypothetical protein